MRHCGGACGDGDCSTHSGTLYATWSGDRVRFSMDLPDDHQHAFTVERFHGLAEVRDDNGNTKVVEDWRAIPGCKYVTVDCCFDDQPVMLEGTARYRALAYELHEQATSGVKVLRTHGVYTAPVTITGSVDQWGES